MALIKCLECNKNVSTKAINCPHCGAPILKEEKDIELLAKTKGKTVEEIAAVETMDYHGGKAANTGTDLAAGCTITLDGPLAAIAKLEDEKNPAIRS